MSLEEFQKRSKGDKEQGRQLYELFNRLYGMGRLPDGDLTAAQEMRHTLINHLACKVHSDWFVGNDISEELKLGEVKFQALEKYYREHGASGTAK